jgi:hypothetical protein
MYVHTTTRGHGDNCLLSICCICGARFLRSPDSFPLTYLIEMPSSRVKYFIKDLDLGKVFAVRLSRFAKNGRTQHSSTTAQHEGDHSVPADIPSEFPAPSPAFHSISPLLVYSDLARDPGLQVPINIFTATSSRVDSSARTASDMAQTFLPVVQAVAGAIPFAGPPMQATISGLLSILQAMDVRAYLITRMFLDSNAITET